MLAARYRQGEGLTLEETAVPRAGVGELLLAVECASICATDLRIVSGGHRKYTPGTVRVPGHELVGRVAAIGAGVRGFSPGQRLFVAPNMGCGKCLPCRRGKNNLCANYDAFGITLDGGFAEYMRVTAPAIEQGNLLPVPDGIDPAEVALAEPLACCLHGQDQVATAPGDVVLILGAGPIGLMHILLARRQKAGLIIAGDLSEARLESARALGAGACVLVSRDSIEEAVADLTRGAGADVVIVAAPSAAAQRQAVAVAGIGGRINFFAGMPKDSPEVPIDSNAVHYRELCVTGTTGCSTADCHRAAALVLNREVDLKPLISARFPLRDVHSAFEAARSPQNLKIVLETANYGHSSV
jgi:L-iditol 2-dehydrogenase